MRNEGRAGETMARVPHEHDFGIARCSCGDSAAALIARCFETMREQAEYANDLLARVSALTEALEAILDATQTHTEEGYAAVPTTLYERAHAALSAATEPQAKPPEPDGGARG